MCRWRVFKKVNVCKVALIIFVGAFATNLWVFADDLRSGGAAARWEAERALLKAKSEALGISVADAYVRAVEVCRPAGAGGIITFDQAQARMNSFTSEGACMRAWAYPPAELETATQWRALLQSVIGLGIIGAMAGAVTLAATILLITANWVHGKGLRLLGNWLTS